MNKYNISTVSVDDVYELLNFKKEFEYFEPTDKIEIYKKVLQYDPQGIIKATTLDDKIIGMVCGSCWRSASNVITVW